MLYDQNKSKAIRAKKAPVLNEYRKHFELFLMLLPGLCLMILFKYVPMYGIIIAFKDFKALKGILGSSWVGFDNFRMVFKSHDFYLVVRNTITISLLKLVCGFPAPIILALLLNELKNAAFKKVIQTFTYLPHFFSWVVLSGIMMFIFSTSGPVNTTLKFFGLDKPISFFGDPVMFIALLIITAVWQSVGWGSVIYLATLSGIDETLYEAACIDGASRWKQTVNITLPCLIPTIIVVFILHLGSVLDAGFDQIYNMYNATVYSVSDILDTFVLRRLQRMDYSFGTAVGLFKSVVGLVFIVSANYIANKVSDHENGLW